jgi:hypothetical protein
VLTETYIAAFKQTVVKPGPHGTQLVFVAERYKIQLAGFEQKKAAQTPAYCPM